MQPDEGGELRALDLHKLQGFARVLNPAGMPLDTAREAAVEAGYMHPDSDINDLLDALRRNQAGQPVFSESDPAAVEWRAFERARQGGNFEPMPPLPGEPATWDATAAARYRAAADATRARSQTFNNPVIGPALQERGGMYRVAESRLPERFISSPEGVQAFLGAGGDVGTLRDALVADLRRSATNPDGSLNTTRFASWQMRRAAALRVFPDLRQQLGDAASAQQAVDAAEATARQQRLDFERGAARHFLAAEPVQAVQSALSGKNPVSDMRALAGMVAADPDAKAGLQRAVADWIAQRTIRAPAGEAEIGTMGARAFNELVRRNKALGAVFSPEQLQAINNIAADLWRGAQPLPTGGAEAGTSSLLRNVVFGHGAAGIASIAGYLWGGFHGALEAFGGYEVAKKAMDAITRAGIERTDQLLTEALLHPELARTLLMKVTPANRPFIAKRLASQFGTLAAVSGAQAAGGPRQQQPMRQRRATPRAAAPAIPPPAFGSLAPGGAVPLR